MLFAYPHDNAGHEGMGMRMLTMGQTPHATYCATVGETFTSQITNATTTTTLRIDAFGFTDGSTVKNGALISRFPLPPPPPTLPDRLQTV